MSLHLKLDLPFDGDIMFSGFLPEAEADWLVLVLREGKYRVSVQLSDRSKQLSNVSDVPQGPKQLEHYENLYCSSLTVEIEAGEVDRDAVDALEAAEPTEKTEALAVEVFEVVLELHNGLVGYFRSIAKEYWLKPLAPDPRNYRQFVQHQWGLSWLDSAGEWQRFPFPRHSIQHLTAQIQEWGVDRDDWREVGPFIQRGARAPMRHVLISNSLAHLSEHNGRLAVVEAVTALESTIRQLLGRVILALPGAPQIEEALLDKVIEKAGLRLVTQVGLKMVAKLAGLDLGDIEKVIQAVDERNNVVHREQRQVSISLARGYVAAIRRVINTLESWTESGAGN